ncbi:hypothetical protein D3C76_1362480 [compost metagenome]
MQRQLDEWQQESAAGSERALTMAGDFQALEDEKRRLAEQLQEITDSYELISHQFRLLQLEREKEQEQQVEREEEYQRLKNDYAKLQSEYNEWIELLEQDQG